MLDNLKLFTFHYVSISTNNSLARFYSKCIYIPLCIYFNAPARRCGSRKYLFTFHYVSISTTIVATIEHININLHSTMYLFQPVLSDRDRYLVLIYIPLCIYFNENNSLMTRNGSSIYIPLCIYFN